MARFARQHEYRIGRALVGAAVLVVLGAWLFPVGWLRFFGRALDPSISAESRVGEAWVRLIPAEAMPGGDPPDVVRIRISLDLVSTVPDHTSPPTRHEWSFDPTTPWRPLAGDGSPLAASTPDSVLLHAEFLHSMRLGNMAAVYALLDTTQAGRAREQLAESDRWFQRHQAPVWEAEGRAVRVADVWWRAVGEVEAEGSQ